MKKGIALNEERFKCLLEAKKTRDWSYLKQFIDEEVFSKYAKYAGDMEPISIVIIAMRFIYKKTLSKISEILGYTPERVRQIVYVTCRRIVTKKLIGELSKIDRELSDKVVSFYIDKYAYTSYIPFILWSHPGRNYILKTLDEIGAKND